MDTGWLDRLTAADDHFPDDLADVAIVAAALDAADELHAIDRRRFFGWASRGRPQLDAGRGQQIELRHGAVAYRVDVRRVGPQSFVVGLAGRSLVVRAGNARSGAQPADNHRATASRWSRRSTAPPTSSKSTESLTASPATTPACYVLLRPPWSSPSTCHPATSVTVGDRVAVVEAMKMEIAVNAPISGSVTEVFVARNVQVDGGEPLLRIEPSGAGRRRGRSRRRRSRSKRWARSTNNRSPATIPSRPCGRFCSATTFRWRPPWPPPPASATTTPPRAAPRSSGCLPT